MTYIFRRATPADAAQIAVLVAELNAFHGDDFNPQAEAYVSDWAHFEVYVAEHLSTGNLVGFLAGYRTYQFHSCIKRFEINNLHVTENHRRKGVAQKLFELVIHKYTEEGVQKFSLGVEKVNKGAQQFYEAMFFEQRPDNAFRYSLSGGNLERFLKKPAFD